MLEGYLRQYRLHTSDHPEANRAQPCRAGFWTPSWTLPPAPRCWASGKRRQRCTTLPGHTRRSPKWSPSCGAASTGLAWQSWQVGCCLRMGPCTRIQRPLIRPSHSPTLHPAQAARKHYCVNKTALSKPSVEEACEELLKDGMCSYFRGVQAAVSSGYSHRVCCVPRGGRDGRHRRWKPRAYCAELGSHGAARSDPYPQNLPSSRSTTLRT